MLQAAKVHAAVAAAAISTIPLWWCIACPTIAGLAAPLVINYLCYFAALLIIKLLKVPKDQQATYLCAPLSLRLAKQCTRVSTNLLSSWVSKRSMGAMQVGVAGRRSGPVHGLGLAHLCLL